MPRRAQLQQLPAPKSVKTATLDVLGTFCERGNDAQSPQGIFAPLASLPINIPPPLHLLSVLPSTVCRNGCAITVTAIFAPHPVLKLQVILRAAVRALFASPITGPQCLTQDPYTLSLASGIWHFDRPGLPATIFLRRCLGPIAG